MPIIRAKNHPDCSIDCPGVGYAEYHEPVGPCSTGCGKTKTSDNIVAGLLRQGKTLNQSMEPIRSSGALWASLSLHELIAERLVEVDLRVLAPTVKDAIENYRDVLKAYYQSTNGSRDMKKEKILYEKRTKAELLDLLAAMIEKNTPSPLLAR